MHSSSYGHTVIRTPSETHPRDVGDPVREPTVGHTFPAYGIYSWPTSTTLDKIPITVTITAVTITPLATLSAPHPLSFFLSLEHVHEIARVRRMHVEGDHVYFLRNCRDSSTSVDQPPPYYRSSLMNYYLGAALHYTKMRKEYFVYVYACRWVAGGFPTRSVFFEG